MPQTWIDPPRGRGGPGDVDRFAADRSPRNRALAPAPRTTLAPVEPHRFIRLGTAVSNLLTKLEAKR